MNNEIHKAARCFIGYFGNEPVCFFAVLHFPHASVNNFKRGHRLVVLPDYQGLGIGHVFSTGIAEYYKQQGFRFIITSSTKSLFTQRARDVRWRVTNKAQNGTSRGKIGFEKSTSKNKITYSYEYVGKPGIKIERVK
jgi:GNAT superfamily N-acetyltransferase